MKVLWLTSFPVEAACTRYRCAQYFEFLREQGIECDISPFLNAADFRALYRRGGWPRRVVGMLMASARRLLATRQLFRADVVCIQREAMLFGPAWMEWLAARVLTRPTVFDFDDAIFVPYVSPTYGRWASWAKFPQKTAGNLRRSCYVVAGNDYLAQFALRYNARVEVVPTVVDTNLYGPALRDGNAGTPVIGWIGSPTTTQYLRPLLPVLNELGRTHQFVFKVVGASEPLRLDTAPVQNTPWKLEREVADFQSLDIGLYPLKADEWSVGKCGFKAIQYMAAGVPCIASPVGVNREIVQHGQTGFHAATAEEWSQCLRQLLNEPALRRQLGHAGRQRAVDRFSLQAHAPRWARILREVAAQASE